MKSKPSQRQLEHLIAVSAEFDHYRTGMDLAILGLPLAVKLRGEMLVVRMRHRLWADSRCLIRGHSDGELF